METKYLVYAMAHGEVVIELWDEIGEHGHSMTAAQARARQWQETVGLDGFEFEVRPVTEEVWREHVAA